jgi:glycosyltransferase involved in cell wall biosynthesis
MTHCGYTFEILLINDGSTDGSDHALSQLPYSNIRFFSQKNQGLGSVLQLGFAEATGEILIILDLDLSYDIQNMRKVIHLSKNWDCVVCSKYAKTNIYPFHRKVLSILFYFFCKWVFKVSVRDMGSGFVLVHSRWVRNESFISKGFGIHCEFFLSLNAQKARILEIPINYSHFPGSFRIFKHSIQTIKELIAIFFKQQKKITI